MSTGKRIVTVVGARPQFVKLAAVSPHLRGHFDEILVHTGQHYDYAMSKLMFEQLDLPEPTHHLQVGSGPHGWQLAEMIKKIEEIVLTSQPVGMLVFGDTNSTLAGALAACKHHVPIAHVEAGLRSFNRRMPEEINRVLTDHASSLLFAPTKTAVANLAAEGIRSGVHHTGDVMCDVLNTYRPRLAEAAKLLQQLELTPRRFFVATVHRAENTNDAERLLAILQGLAASPLPVIFPVHPRTRARIGELGQEALLASGSLRPIEPVGYLEMLALMKDSAAVFTDSGGIQKEACLLEVPCATMRDETEWVETISAGWNRLVPPTSAAITGALHEMARTSGAERQSLEHEYGTGHAGEEIVRLLAMHWSN